MKDKNILNHKPFWGASVGLIPKFLAETLQAKKECHENFMELKENSNNQNQYLSKLSFSNNEKIKTLPDKGRDTISSPHLFYNKC